MVMGRGLRGGVGRKSIAVILIYPLVVETRASRLFADIRCGLKRGVKTSFIANMVTVISAMAPVVGRRYVLNIHLYAK